MSLTELILEIKSFLLVKCKDKRPYYTSLIYLIIGRYHFCNQVTCFHKGSLYTYLFNPKISQSILFKIIGFFLRHGSFVSLVSPYFQNINLCKFPFLRLSIFKIELRIGLPISGTSYNT